MYLDSLILTRKPPEVQIAERRVVLGEVFDGVHLVEEFPTKLEFGVYMELGFEPQEHGEHEVRVVGELVAEALKEERTLFHRDDVYIWEPDSDWWLPRLRAFPFEAQWELEDEADFQLLVYGRPPDGDSEFLGDKPILIRRCVVPDGPGDL